MRYPKGIQKYPLHDETNGMYVASPADFMQFKKKQQLINYSVKSVQGITCDRAKNYKGDMKKLSEVFKRYAKVYSTG